MTREPLFWRGDEPLFFTGEWPSTYSRGVTALVHDDLELGERVALYLDSENNASEVHFIGWHDDILPPDA